MLFIFAFWTTVSLHDAFAITGRQEGGFVKGWFWRMCPRSGFRFGGTCERTLVPVFVPGEHPNVPSFRFSFRGNICQNHPFGKPPLSLVPTPEKRPFSRCPSAVARGFSNTGLDFCRDKLIVAPYRAIPRDYLSDTLLLRAVGVYFLVSHHDQLDAIPPPPFSERSPLKSMRSGGAIPPPPPTKEVSQRYLRDTT